VMFFPDGLAGVWVKYSHKLNFFKKKSSLTSATAIIDSTKNEVGKKTVNEIDVTNIEGAKA
jgi:hypothetical protein